MNTTKPKDVDSYIAGSAGEAQPVLNEVRAIIKAAVPEAEEGISYSVPFYKYRGALAGFAVYKQHVSFGTGGDLLPDEVRAMLEEQGYKTGKKTVLIRFDQPVPTAALTQILEAQAAANEAKRAAK